MASCQTVCRLDQVKHDCTELTMHRHLPNQDQAASRALRDPDDGPHTISLRHDIKLTVVDIDG
jgi:hypothetical protein